MMGGNNTNAATNATKHSCTHVCLLRTQTNTKIKKLLLPNTRKVPEYSSRETSTMKRKFSSITNKVKRKPSESIKLQQRKALDKLANRLRITKQEDWYKVTVRQARRYGAGDLLGRYFDHSLLPALQTLYPEYEWNPLLFPALPRRYYSNLNNHRKFFDWIAEHMGIETQMDWYNTTAAQVAKFGSSAILFTYYNNSLLNALRTVYPEYEWHSLFVPRSPRSQRQKEHRHTMDRLSEVLGIQTQEDWYKYRADHVKQFDAGNKLIREHGHSLFHTLQSVYPEFQWHKIKFQRGPHNQYLTIHKRREVFDWIAEEKGIQQQHEWYHVTAAEVKEMGARTMLSMHYNGSLLEALKSVYPEFTWNPLLCVYPPQHYMKSLSVSTIEDTFNQILQQVPVDSWKWGRLINSREFYRVSRKFGGRLSTLNTFFPDANWSLSPDTLGERYVEIALKGITRIEKQKKIKGYSIDLFLPELSLGIEYQGKQHYQQTHRGSLLDQLQRDDRKLRELKNLGVNLIQIPYWWNKSPETLLNTMKIPAYV